MTWISEEERQSGGSPGEARSGLLVAVAALVGALVLSYWVTRPLPYTEWWLGLLGLLLTLPWFASRRWGL